MLRVGHGGGLGNRLDELTTAYVLAEANGSEDLEVHWPLNEHMPSRFDDLFTALPRGTLVGSEIGCGDAQAFDLRRRQLPSEFRASAAYRKALLEILGVVVPEVGAAVARTRQERAHWDRVVGVHVRRAESSAPICPFAQPLRYYEAVMRSFPEETPFFISTDSPAAFRWIGARFGECAFQQDKLHHNRTGVAGVREGLADLLLLSGCRAVIGTYQSSFSHLAALAGDRPLLMIRPGLAAPEGWPDLGAARRLWAQRHFFRESTFWSRWLYYSVRPAVALWLGRLLPSRLVRRLNPWNRSVAGQ